MIDPIDRRILRAMLLDARIQNQDLAAKVNLSPSGCLQRVRRLEKEGIIRRYVVDIDEHELGSWVTLWGEIVLTPEGRAQRKVLERAFDAAPEVIEARQLVGRADYLLKVVSREAGAWPILLQRIDADARFIATSTVQIEAGIAKRFGTLPQLEAGQ
ncbi:MAG: Lrp/AsnC family transcriptional regulator [Hyphomonadaceae bacterium]|nr:Lrp/AsnC family transcriptional regulator [Hyphomonadaceae bacterium]